MASRFRGELSLLGAVALSAALSWAYGCSKGQQGAKTQAPPPAPVSTAVATTRSVPVEISTFGRVEAYLTVNVKSQVTGQFAEVYVREGQEVGKGDPVLLIDPRSFTAALKLAESNMARDAANAKYARTELARTQSLFDSKSASSDDLDRSRSTAEAAEATVRADEAAVDNAKLQVEYCSIRSPIDGRVGSFVIDVGSYIKANDLTIVTINQTKPIYVSFSVPETGLAGIRAHMSEGVTVSAAVPGDDQQAAEGKLSFVDNTVDAGTGTIRLKALFENADERLWPGQYVRVIVKLTNIADAVVVPSSAVQSGQAGTYVFIVKDDMAVENRPVTTGPDVEGLTVVETGVAAGETVVTDGQLRLVPGAKVQVVGARSAGAGK